MMSLGEMLTESLPAAVGFCIVVIGGCTLYSKVVQLFKRRKPDDVEDTIIDVQDTQQAAANPMYSTSVDQIEKRQETQTERVAPPARAVCDKDNDNTKKAKRKGKSRDKRRRHSYVNITRKPETESQNTRRKLSLSGMELAKLPMEGYAFAKDVSKDSAPNGNAETARKHGRKHGSSYDHVVFKPDAIRKISDKEDKYVYFYNHLERPRDDDADAEMSNSDTEDTYNRLNADPKPKSEQVIIHSHDSVDYSNVTLPQFGGIGNEDRKKGDYDDVEIGGNGGDFKDHTYHHLIAVSKAKPEPIVVQPGSVGVSPVTTSPAGSGNRKGERTDDYDDVNIGGNSADVKRVNTGTKLQSGSVDAHPLVTTDLSDVTIPHSGIVGRDERIKDDYDDVVIQVQ